MSKPKKRAGPSPTSRYCLPVPGDTIDRLNLEARQLGQRFEDLGKRDGREDAKALGWLLMTAGHHLRREPDDDRTVEMVDRLHDVLLTLRVGDVHAVRAAVERSLASRRRERARVIDFAVAVEELRARRRAERRREP